MEIKGKVILKKDRVISVERFHPWIFSGAIQHVAGKVDDGCWVEVEGNKKILGYGHYHQGSIAVRMLHQGTTPPTESFWREKFERALSQRYASGLPTQHTNCFRLIHGEGDGLSGLIVDIYNGVAVVQCHNRGMSNDLNEIAEALRNLSQLGLTGIYSKDKSEKRDIESDGTLSASRYLWGIGAVPHVIQENDKKFLVDWEEGQKTGFFLDQRENRQLLMSYSANKHVLNTFCYTGGFSVYAIAANAALVHSVDASERAIALARKNIEVNGYDAHKHGCYVSDTFAFLKDKSDFYDVIILDPPAFAKHVHNRHQAVKGYQRLNAEAMKVVKRGGIIFTFSCSQVVDKKLFFDTVVSAAIQAGRQIKVLHQLSQPPDHPVSLFHPEGEYLKGLVLYVE